MLYHWYELDLETEAPLRASPYQSVRIGASAIRYNAATAIAHANGAPYRLNTPELTLKAANDRHADATAIQLRKAGLGVIGERRQRAQPGDYTTMRQTVKLCQSTLSFISACASGAISFVTQRRGQNVYGCSHTIVSNGSDDLATARDDAQRQRFDVSIG